MSGPSKKSLRSRGKPEDLIVYVEWLRQQAEEFQRAVEEEYPDGPRTPPR